MNYFQLVLKQMRQRALSTWLTMLSVTLGVGLAVAIMILGRESQSLFGQNDYGFDAIIGKKGSKLQLVLNTIYHLDVSPGNIPYDQYTRLLDPHFPKGMPLPADNYFKYVKIAEPTVVGDTLNGQYRIVGVRTSFFGFDEHGDPMKPDDVIDYRPGKKLEIADGHVFAFNKFEAVVGSDIPRLTGNGVGTTLQATHTPASPGHPADIHMQQWTVVGVLAPTHTAIDRVVYIPLLSFYTIAEHGAGLIAQAKLRQGEAPPEVDPDSDADHPHLPDANGMEHFSNYNFDTKDQTIHLNLEKLPPEVWAISAILVQSRGGDTEQALEYALNNGTDVMAVNPASVMREFFDTFLKPMRWLLLLICSLVTVVAAVGILVSIYNSVSARLKEIAIIRALGATRTTVLTLICIEAGLVALFGSVLGLLAGHGVNALGAWYMSHNYGEVLGYDYVELFFEAGYILAVLVLAIIAGLVPAMKAYRTPVATNLVAT
ncbi:MAG: ABC transporter permease [Tepidisphaeraceae bacterium]|jgi:putative ABC transport system permease protein